MILLYIHIFFFEINHVLIEERKGNLSGKLVIVKKCIDRSVHRCINSYVFEIQTIHVD